ncbi:MAG: DNA recombination protein RmuC, partial [Candidatus Levybacteria bacterium]|nr:DNA recombination protein RmuC [Candidatus Levybacteria bacterium]
MENNLPVLIILVLGFAIIIYLINRKSSSNKTDQSLLEWLKTMQGSIDSTNKAVNEALNNTSNHMVKTLQENSKQLNERLDKAASVIKDVGTEVGKMSEIGRNMRELQDFLKSPKLRGNIGEQVLKDLIS